MIAILTLLAALPIGYLVRHRTAGFLAYGLAVAHLFTFQTAVLVMNWAQGDRTAFTGTDDASTLPYLVVTTLIQAAGFGLVAAGQRLRARRESRRAVVQLDPA